MTIVPSRLTEWIVPLIIALASFLISGWSAYSHNDKDVSNRMSVVENQQKNDGARLDRIENKVDGVGDKVDRVLEAIHTKDPR